MHWLTSVNEGIYQINRRITLLLKITNYPVYPHLNKTHKTDTILQIRPIISSLEGSLYKISLLLAQILKPLLLTCSGHVKNSDEVIHRLTQQNTEQLNQNKYAFSLDVISLYTTLPAHSAIDLISEHIISKNLYCHKLAVTNTHQLLSIIVDNTYFSYNGNTYKQTPGLPMGSSNSGILAISYMNQLKRRALSICPPCIFFTRYIDDILMLTSSSEEATAIYEKF